MELDLIKELEKEIDFVNGKIKVLENRKKSMERDLYDSKHKLVDEIISIVQANPTGIINAIKYHKCEPMGYMIEGRCITIRFSKRPYDYSLTLDVDSKNCFRIGNYGNDGVLIQEVYKIQSSIWDFIVREINEKSGVK